MSKFPLIKKTLPSGLRTIILPRAEMASATIMVLIGVGSRYETPKQSGLSHFLEHMFFKGTTSRPTTKEIAEAIDNVGGDFNAFTSEEYTGYYVKVASEYLEKGAEVVADILLNPLFPEEEIERERGVIQEEIKMYTDNPMRHVNHLWQHALYGDSGLGRRIDGTKETVSAFKRKDFINYVKTHYHTGNAIVVVAGNVDPKKTQKMIGEMFTPLADGAETNPKPAPKKSPAKNFVHEFRKSLDQTHIIVGVPGVSDADPRKYAATLLAAILGGGMSSRLFLSVRERNGLAYMVRTSSENYTDTGSFATQTGVRTDKALQALKLILEEYDRVMEEPVTKEELDKVKKMVRGSLVLDLEETNALALFSSTQELTEHVIKTPDQIMKEVNKVTIQDIQDVARELLRKDKRAIALLGPQKTSTAFEKLLK
ncbi:MAG: pitrilysin family protein [Candidatus Andersenbacteria bacterium]